MIICVDNIRKFYSSEILRNLRDTFCQATIAFSPEMKLHEFKNDRELLLAVDNRATISQTTPAVSPKRL